MITRVATCVDALVVVIADRVQSVRETIDPRSIDRPWRSKAATMTLSIEIASYRLQYPAIFRAIRIVTVFIQELHSLRKYSGNY